MRNLCLEYRVRKLEKLLINEGKQVGTLYHICDVKQFIKYVLPKDQLKASGKYYNGLYKGNDYISFTRNKYYTLVHDLSDYSGVFIRLVIDGDRLSDNYRVGPYNDVQFDIETGEFLDLPSDGDDAPKYREQEEAVKGPINNLSRYLKEVQIDIADLSDNTLKVLKSSAKKLAAVNVVYTNFMKRAQSTAVNKCIRATGLRDGDSLSAMLDAMKRAAKANPEPLLFSRDIRKVQQAIDADIDLNTEYNMGYPLGYYCYWNNYDIVKLLIENGADVNTGDGKEPAICKAAGNASTDIVKLLIENGADVNAEDKDGNTAVIEATWNKDAINVLKLLIAAGADVNHVNHHRMTAVKLADDDIKDFLIASGANE